MKKILTLAAATALSVCCLSGCGKNEAGSQEKETVKTQEESFAGGSGTQEAPYQIATADQMRTMAELINANVYDNTYSKASYILTDDIDLGGEKNPWEPVGTGYVEGKVAFAGTFDGDGHTIRNMHINSEERYVGLFAFINCGGSVQNLTIAASTITAEETDNSASCGAIVGGTESEFTMKNCHTAEDVSIEGTYITGGLTGAMNSGVIEECSNAAEVTGSSKAGQTGGIIGRTMSEESRIAACTNSGDITGNDAAGGIAGAFGGNLENCENQGMVEAVKNAGGIIGVSNALSTDGTPMTTDISECKNSGNVTGSENAGGISGELITSGGEITIQNCENSGAVSAENKASGVLALYLSSGATNFTVQSCKNVGEVKTTNEEKFAVAGGILGDLNLRANGNILVEDCINTANVEAAYGCSGGILGSYGGVLSKEKENINLDMIACSNEGNVTGKAMGVGGIAGVISAKEYPVLALTMENCSNAGTISAYGISSIGGIVGVFEPHHGTAVFSSCVNSGALKPENVDAQPEEEAFHLTVAVGGIAGHIGENGITAREDDDFGFTEPVVTFESCENQGELVTFDSKYVTYKSGDLYGTTAVPVDEK